MRYWTRCISGKYSVLYRLDRLSGAFELLVGCDWRGSSDRYRRVTWDTDRREISQSEANLIAKAILNKDPRLC